MTDTADRDAAITAVADALQANSEDTGILYYRNDCLTLAAVAVDALLAAGWKAPAAAAGTTTGDNRP